VKTQATLLALLCCLGVPAEVVGQSVDVARPEATVGTDFDGTWIQLDNPFSRSRMREWVQLGLGGSLFDPRYFTFQLEVRPHVGQGWATPNPGGGTLDENGVTGGVELNLFPGFGITGSLSASRIDQYQPNAFGGFMQVNTWTRKAVFFDRNPLLPLTISHEARKEDHVFTTGPELRQLGVERDIQRTRVQAHNWKTRLLINRINVDGVAGRQPERWDQRQALFSNKQQWGKGSSVLNQVEWNQRLHDREFERRRISNFTRLQQAGALATELEGELVTESGPDWTAAQRVGRARVIHDPSDALRVSLEWSGRSQDFDQFHRFESKLLPNVSFSRPFSSWITLSGNVLGSYSWNSQSSDFATFAFVTQERHVLGPNGSLRLMHPFVDVESIVLENADDGTRYERDFDYRVVEDGPFTSIVALPGSRLQDAVNLVVDYRHQVAPEVSTRAMTLRAALSLQVGAVRLFYRRNIRDDLDDLGTIAFPTIEDLDQEQAGVQVNRSLAQFDLSLMAAVEKDRSTSFRLSRRIMTVSEAAAFSRTVGQTTRGSYVKSEGGVLPYRTLEIQESLNWKPSPRVRLEAFGSYFLWEDPQRNDRFFGAGLLLTVEFANTTGRLRFDRVDWTTRGNRQENRLSLRFQQAL
jgi:hypothetical protein